MKPSMCNTEKQCEIAQRQLTILLWKVPCGKYPPRYPFLLRCLPPGDWSMSVNFMPLDY